MKKITSLIVIMIPMTLNAAAPSTTCPSGYVAAGTVPSCITSPNNGYCIMYIPKSQSFSDDSGTYEYTDICLLQ